MDCASHYRAHLDLANKLRALSGRCINCRLVFIVGPPEPEVPSQPTFIKRVNESGLMNR